MTAMWLIILCGLAAIAYGVWATQSVLAAEAGNARMQEIAAAIREGATAMSTANSTSEERLTCKSLPSSAVSSDLSRDSEGRIRRRLRESSSPIFDPRRPQRSSACSIIRPLGSAMRSGLLTGAVIGVVVAVISGLIGTGDGSIGTGQLIGYLAMMFGLLGALLGGAAAVVIERFSRPPTR